MSNFSQFPQISLDEVLKRINAGATVITQNRRLALALKEKFNSSQISQKMTVWHTADVLPFTALIERIYLDALYTPQAVQLPLLLSSLQEQALWESIIQSSEVGSTLLRVHQTAQLVREAWQLMHAWQLNFHREDFYLNEDVKTFLNWSEIYQNVTAHNHQIDHARVCDLLTDRYEFLDIKRISALICYGFDVITPQQSTFLNKLVSSGCEVVNFHPATNHQWMGDNARRSEFVSSQDEIYQAAVWARSKIERTDLPIRVGIVVPALASYRSALMRIFSAIMYPDARCALPNAIHPVLPFNISLGLALTSYPLIEAAFVCLALLDQSVEFNRVSHWLRSPFLAGGEIESDLRALLDARIRQYAEPTITLERLLTLLQKADAQSKCPILLKHLSALAQFRQTNLPKSENHLTFARVITEALQIVGFPGERNLDSIEYQTFKKWQSLVADFPSLDCVIARTNYHDAIGQLHRIASDTLFQPETPEVPIQILGVLEAANMEFDYVWVMGLSDKQWPLQSRPNPFLPLDVQRNAKMPLGSTLEASVYCRRLTQGWLSSAKEIVLSYPKFSDDLDDEVLKPSPLIQSVPENKLLFSLPIQHRDLIMQSCELEQIEDSHALPLHIEVIKQGIRGGTSVIKDYAACPFRAWAKHRLHIESLSAPHAGLNALERGLLVHQVLAQLWGQLNNKDALDAINDRDLESMLIAISRDVVFEMQTYRPSTLSGRFAHIEQRRLVGLVSEWLNEEKKRNPFVVIAIEEKRTLRIGDLELSARLDRVDQLESGQQIVIDYKTRKQSIQALIGERPDEPQLPLYLVMIEAERPAAGVAFAEVKRGDMGFTAIVRDSDLLPGVKAFGQLNGCRQFNTWEDLIVAWRQHLTNLAVGFCSGDAQVNPKNFPKTCEYCDMHLFCRIHERVGESMTAQDNEDD